MYALCFVVFFTQLIAQHDVLACPQPVVPSAHFPPGLNLGVHVYTDVNHTNHFGSRDKALKYVLQFFKSVFLRFSSAHDNLKLSLVNVTLLNDSSVENECFVHGTAHYRRLGNRQGTVKYVDLEQSLKKFRECLTSGRLKDAPQKAPMIIVLTGYETRSLGKPLPGKAETRGGICTQNLGIGPDYPGSFIGVLATVRLLARLMGSQYDGYRKDANAKNANCYSSARRVMSYYEDSGLNNNIFSPCSLAEMEAAMKSLNETCKGVPTGANMINSSIKYPGETTSLKEQCKAIYSTLIPKPTRSVECVTGCEHNARGRTITGPPPEFLMLDGTECNNYDKCYNGQCTNRIPHQMT